MTLIIGSHVSVSQGEMLVGAVKDTISYGGNAFMFYTGAPQNTSRKPIHLFQKEEAHRLMNQHGIQKEHVLVHAPYIINMANTTNPSVMELAYDFLKEEVSRVHELGFIYLVIHPGSHVGEGVDAGIHQIVTILNRLFEHDTSNVQILLETMSGKGSEIGFDLHHIQTIFQLVHKTKERLGICLDTCHLHDAGFDIGDFDSILNEIDSLIGLEYVKAVHINDSKNKQGDKKDRHENIGFGYIGFDRLLSVIYHPKLVSVPKILETPWIGDNPPYKQEIAMIRTRRFDPDLKEKLTYKKG